MSPSLTTPTASTAAKSDPVQIGILLFDAFPAMALACLTEPLRVFNSLSGGQRFSWSLLGFQTDRVTSSSGLEIAVSGRFESLRRPPDLLALCTGGNATALASPQLVGRLQEEARRGVAFVTVADAPLLLAAANLLDGRQIAIHWQYADLLQESSPAVRLSRDLICLDPPFFSCHGGASAFDLSLELIRHYHGEPYESQLKAWFLYDLAGPGAQRQDDFLFVSDAEDHLLAAFLELAYASIDRGLTIADMAASLSTAPSTLNRHCRERFGLSAGATLLKLRINRAKRLLSTTRMTNVEIAVACGFSSAEHFATRFRKASGSTPRSYRAVRQAAAAAGQEPGRPATS
ncbi:GlxA family transcriptional regulator [Algihabitans albus]|uniref:GlxA family transcriptional regulator n=1 Tax=Algihabitans albus TaxID=2164067 RepID=UPI000E5D6B5E|nr:helix-turn-helix domain-containing protein [Algihabitans albus]